MLSLLSALLLRLKHIKAMKQQKKGIKTKDLAQAFMCDQSTIPRLSVLSKLAEISWIEAKCP